MAEHRGEHEYRVCEFCGSSYVGREADICARCEIPYRAGLARAADRCDYLADVWTGGYACAAADCADDLRKMSVGWRPVHKLTGEGDG